MRCIRPGVPGIAHGRASVSGSRRYGQNTSPWLGSVANGVEMSGRESDVGELPGLGAVGEVAVGEEDDRRAVLHRDAHRLERGVEAVGRRLGRHDRERRLAVPAVHREHEVGLLGLGGQAGRRSAALHVDEQHRQLEAEREPDRLRLEVDARPARARDREAARERGADGRTRGRDLVLGLQRAHAEVLELRQLVEDVGRGRDRVRRVEQRQLRLLRRRDESVRQRDVAGDVAVRAGRQLRGLRPRTGGRRARRSRRSCTPAMNAARFASSTWGRFAKRLLIQSTSGSVGRVYIQQISPSAKKFFERSASRGFTPSGLVASTVIDVIGTS